MKAPKQTGYLNLIFVKLNDAKTHLQFTNSSKWHPLQKKWDSAKREMKPGVSYVVATTVTPSLTASGTSWNVIGVLAPVNNDLHAIELNAFYWDKLEANKYWPVEKKTSWAVDFGSALVLEHLPAETITINNQTTWKIMKLFQNPSCFMHCTTSKSKVEKFNELFEF